MKYGRLFHWVFEHDPAMGFSADRINYGPVDVTASSWIIPGTICEEEPYEDFASLDEAVAAYNQAALARFGEFATLNPTGET